MDQNLVTPLPDAILDIANGARRAQMLATAFDLKIFDLLESKGPLTSQELTFELSIHMFNPVDFFDALFVMGLLERDDDKKYSNSAAAKTYCISSDLRYIGAWVQRLGSLENHPMAGFTSKITDENYVPLLHDYSLMDDEFT